MKIKCRTNIDEYRTKEWPRFTNHIPRKGELIECCDEPFIGSNGNKYPNKLEVVAVRYKSNQGFTWGEPKETIVEVELWFTEADFNAYGGGTKLLN